MSEPVRLNVDFLVSMALVAQTSDYDQCSAGSSAVDFWDSAKTTALALSGPSGTAICGFSLAADSPHVYLPAPEPAAWAMWRIGLVAVAVAVAGSVRGRRQ